jgi:hypothetical protein
LPRSIRLGYAIDFVVPSSTANRQPAILIQYREAETTLWGFQRGRASPFGQGRDQNLAREMASFI